MSLTSYRAAPPRGLGEVWWCRVGPFWVGSLGGPGSDRLSRGLSRSIMGAEGFHGRVRDGIGCGTLAMATRSTERPRTGCGAGALLKGVRRARVRGRRDELAGSAWACLLRRRAPAGVWAKPARGARRLEGLSGLAAGRECGSRSVERLGPVSCTRHRACTSGLSTWWSTTALGETWFRGGFPA